MKAIILSLVLIFGVAALATVVLPCGAFECDMNDPGCYPVH